MALVTLFAAAASLRDPLFESQTGVLFGRDVEWSNRMGSFDRTERAAFIVDRGDGIIQCVLWPATYERERATFTGAVPQGTVAIIHTHPGNSPWPSNNDMALARRLGIPVYAMTPLMVTKAAPDDDVPLLVHKGRWLDPPPRHVCTHFSDRRR